MFEIFMLVLIGIGSIVLCILVYRWGYNLGKIDGRLEIIGEYVEEFGRKLDRPK